MTTWSIQIQEYFEAPALSLLLFHDFYPEGKQGGIELIQHGERVITNGDLRLAYTPGQWAELPKFLERKVDVENVSAILSLHYPALELDYQIRLWAEEATIHLAVDLSKPLPAEQAEWLGFNLDIFPGAYFGKTFSMGQTSSIFPRQANGPIIFTPQGRLVPQPLAVGARLTAAAEDPLRKLTITSKHGEMALYDGRNTAQDNWFVLRAPVKAGAAENAVELAITPNAIPGWRRKPNILLSQVGYHPDQVKQALIELESGAIAQEKACLLRIDPELGLQEALVAEPSRWGSFLRYDYAIFDFTSVKEAGLYQVQYGGQTSSPFRIAADVYQHDVWQPTLETFLPVQMCHVKVRDRYQVWHGACHLDDALQAPLQREHFDGYRQGDKTETPYLPFEHIPHLARGGWHDAGDDDLAAGSQASTTHLLALAREAFGVDTDQTAVHSAERLVLLHTPDGIPDIVQQVAHGAENLLGGYRAAGHSFVGLISGSLLDQYTHQGDWSTMTDNRIYSAALQPDEIQGERSGKQDDRWAFTNRDTSLEYKTAAALVAASRVLRSFEPVLAEECLATALKVWEYEHSHEPVEFRNAYVPSNWQVQECLVAGELLLATGEARYRQRLIELLPVIEANAAQAGWIAARALSLIANEDFAKQLHKSMEHYRQSLEDDISKNPFGVPFHPHVWGIAWNIQWHAVRLYYLIQAFPQLFEREELLRVLNYVLGCHPASSTSLASGVGSRSLTTAYGCNRADWSYIPGGVVSGVNLVRPDFPELKEPFPFLWQQSEYVISGAASYIFCVLAADKLLNG